MCMGNNDGSLMFNYEGRTPAIRVRGRHDTGTSMFVVEVFHNGKHDPRHDAVMGSAKLAHARGRVLAAAL
jgi:hypothetical protein